MQQQGEHEAAGGKLRDFFRQTQFTPWDEEQSNVPDRQIHEVLSSEAHAILRQLYLAQVFLSLNAVEAGLDFFERLPEQLPKLVPDHAVARERFASQLALAQLLLNGKRFEEYADLATTVLVPAMLREDLKACDSRTLAEIGSISPALSAGGFCLLPLMADEFVQTLSPKTLARLLPVWAKYRSQTESQVARLWIDRFLTLGFERLGRTQEAAAARERYETNPQQAKYDFYATFHSEVFNLLRQTFSLSDFLNSLGLAKRSPGL